MDEHVVTTGFVALYFIGVIFITDLLGGWDNDSGMAVLARLCAFVIMAGIYWVAWEIWGNKLD